ncbi:hypothetical protein DFS33DRAFT_1273986 [Desarmillaria ectypa]|nr:hypothetical protein DFS33DRAFT_1273986 [Desarmillaria ectypa]
MARQSSKQSGAYHSPQNSSYNTPVALATTVLLCPVLWRRASNLPATRSFPKRWPKWLFDASVEHEGAETSPLNLQDETRLLRKVDSFLIPMFGVFIGNAKVAGMATDLHLVGNQYGAAVSVVYVFVPDMALTIATPFSGSYGLLIAIGVLLGWSEAGVSPCIATYLMMTYRREELGRRCSALSGGFGMIFEQGREGHVCCSVRDEQTHYDPDDKFDIQVVLLAFKDWRTWASGIFQLVQKSHFTPFLHSSDAHFQARPINGMGYSSYHAQLLTVPVYAVAAISFMIQAQFSDRLFLRGPFIIGNFFIQIVGWVAPEVAPSNIF